MYLSKREIQQLQKFIDLTQELLERAKNSEGDKGGRQKPTRIRRSGKDLVAFRKTLRAERKAGVAVAEIARKHGISPAYIYQLG